MSDDHRKKEIDDYLDRFKGLPAEEILLKLGELRSFFYKHMTEEGKRALLESRGIDLSARKPPADQE